MGLAGTGAELAHLTPRPVKGLFGDNYLSFAGTGETFAKQFLPEIYEKEVERYGNRTVSGFLSLVGAEMPMASDEVVWSEQGRIHVAYEGVTMLDKSAECKISFPTGTFGASTADNPNHNLKIGDTVVLAHDYKTLKCYVSNVINTTVVCDPYTKGDLVSLGMADNETDLKVFVYGSEYKKGSKDLSGSLDAKFQSYSNKPIILRDRYSINGSDTAQIGWVEVTTEEGGDGYLWYLKSEHEARIRFEDQLEMAMIEAEKVVSGTSTIDATGISGSEGLFAAVESRGIVYNDQDFDAGNLAGLIEFDNILKELDKQGSIEENMIFCSRDLSLSIDGMLGQLNAGYNNGASYGLFDNEESMALNLGFSGFRRGSYDFYKTDWKYMNDSTTRGLVADVEGVLVPAGTSTVYDQSMGKNISRPFLHVRYRASEADDRKMKSWITGSVGGNYTSDADEMTVNFLSERCLCVQAANNFVIFKATS